MTDRVLRSERETAKRLDMCVESLRKYAKAGKITYVMVGPRRKYEDEDERRFIEARRIECGYSKEKAVPTGTMISNSTVYDFAALREKQRNGQLKKGRTLSSPKPTRDRIKERGQ